MDCETRKKLLTLESMHNNLLPYFFRRCTMTEQTFSEMKDKYLEIISYIRKIISSENTDDNTDDNDVETPQENKLIIDGFIPQLCGDTFVNIAQEPCKPEFKYFDHSMKTVKDAVDKLTIERNVCAHNIIVLNKIITSKLLEFQYQHVKSMIYLLQTKKRKAIVDLSDTGTGKTYCALAVAKVNKMLPVIIAPKSALSIWERVLGIFQIRSWFLTNYESMIKCKGYFGNGTRGICPFIKAEKKIVPKRLSRKETRAGKIAGVKVTTTFEWNFQILEGKPVLLIFDEAHKCKNRTTCNSALLRETTKTPENVKVLMLSATISQRIEDFAIFGECLGFYENRAKMQKWFRDRNIPMTKQTTQWRNSEARLRTILAIHKELFPNYAVRMKINELGDSFPENLIVADSYNVGKERASDIDAAYHEIELALADLRILQLNGNSETNPLVRILRARQRIELYKVETLIEIIEGEISKGNSVPIFVNFQKTVDILCERFKTDCCFTGKNVSVRDDCVNEFMTGKSKLIICNIRAGGTSISLHDTSLDGSMPRVTVISPPWSAIDFKQALGRAVRVGCKSKVVQKLVYIAKSVEERVCNSIREKLYNIVTINDGDLTSYTNMIDGLEKEIEKIDENVINS